MYEHKLCLEISFYGLRHMTAKWANWRRLNKHILPLPTLYTSSLVLTKLVLQKYDVLSVSPELHKLQFPCLSVLKQYLQICIRLKILLLYNLNKISMVTHLRIKQIFINKILATLKLCPEGCHML